MAKTINITRQNKKRTTKKKRGSGCVNSRCVSRTIKNENKAKLQKINKFAERLQMLRDSTIYPLMYDTTKEKLQSLFYIIEVPNDIDDVIEQKFQDISAFENENPKLYRIVMKLSDKMMNVKLKFHRPEEIYKLKVNFLKAKLEDVIDFEAVNEIELIGQERTNLYRTIQKFSER